LTCHCAFLASPALSRRAISRRADEVDRVTDIDLLDERFQPVQTGSRIRITDLVAIIVGNVADEQERKSAHRFLESNTVQVWVNQQLEGR
jgi:hypothetical protein